MRRSERLLNKLKATDIAKYGLGRRVAFAATTIYRYIHRDAPKDQLVFNQQWTLVDFRCLLKIQFDQSEIGKNG